MIDFYHPTTLQWIGIAIIFAVVLYIVWFMLRLVSFGEDYDPLDIEDGHPYPRAVEKIVVEPPHGSGLIKGDIVFMQVPVRYWATGEVKIYSPHLTKEIKMPLSALAKL